MPELMEPLLEPIANELIDRFEAPGHPDLWPTSSVAAHSSSSRLLFGAAPPFRGGGEDTTAPIMHPTPGIARRTFQRAAGLHNRGSFGTPAVRNIQGMPRLWAGSVTISESVWVRRPTSHASRWSATRPRSCTCQFNV